MVLIQQSIKLTSLSSSASAAAVCKRASVVSSDIALVSSSTCTGYNNCKFKISTTLNYFKYVHKI